MIYVYIYQMYKCTVHSQVNFAGSSSPSFFSPRPLAAAAAAIASASPPMPPGRPAGASGKASLVVSAECVGFFTRPTGFLGGPALMRAARPSRKAALGFFDSSL